MPQPLVWSLMLVLLTFQPEQFPSVTVNQSPHPAEERTLPMDRPQVVAQKGSQRHVDPARLTREAKELADLSGEIPSLVDQVNKGVLSKDLNERLKRIEKLSKQLRRELSQ